MNNKLFAAFLLVGQLIGTPMFGMELSNIFESDFVVEVAENFTVNNLEEKGQYLVTGDNFSQKVMYKDGEFQDLLSGEPIQNQALISALWLHILIKEDNNQPVVITNNTNNEIEQDRTPHHAEIHFDAPDLELELPEPYFFEGIEEAIIQTNNKTQQDYTYKINDIDNEIEQDVTTHQPGIHSNDNNFYEIDVPTNNNLQQQVPFHSNNNNLTSNNNVLSNNQPENVVKLTCTIEGCNTALRTPKDMQDHWTSDHFPKKVNKKLKCPACPQECSSPSEWKQHIAIKHTGYNRFTCKLCSLETNFMTSFREHVQKEHSDEALSTGGAIALIKSWGYAYKSKITYKDNSVELRCEVPHCEKSYATSKELYNHLTENHVPKKVDKKLKCPICSKSFGFKGQWQIHIASHIGYNEFVCKFCQYPFIRKGDLTRHIKNKHKREMSLAGDTTTLLKNWGYYNKQPRKVNSSKSLCEVPGCEKNYATAKELHNHWTKDHVPEVVDEKLKCPMCSKSFLSKVKWKIHIAIHTGYKPFICEVCQHTFIQKSNLKTHLKTHKK